MRAADRLTVVKLGGSYAFSPELQAWLDALAACPGRVVLVPGGGPFADAVRRAQAQMGFDDQTAHRMALIAMEQYGWALADLAARSVVANSTASIREALRAGNTPIWSPARMVLAAQDVPASWDMTSDSLAAWLAGRIGAKRLLLVKRVDLSAPSLRADDLVARGLVDPLFPRFLATSGAQAALAGPHDHAAAAAAVRSGALAGARIDL
jgi:dihydroneopterin aldolase